jgi:hypothetical protein
MGKATERESRLAILNERLERANQRELEQGHQILKLEHQLCSDAQLLALNPLG